MKAKQHRQRRTDREVSRAVAECSRHPEALLPVLQQVQHTCGFLDDNAIGATSDELCLPDARTFGVASFYSMLTTRPRCNRVIRVCDGPVCCLHGSESVHATVENAAENHDISVDRTSCLGLCDRAPAALVGDEPCGPIDASRASKLLTRWRGQVPSYAEPRDGELRVAMQRVGKVDPCEIQSAIEHGAYESLKAALGNSAADVLRCITQSGLQGRGGAGFPTGRKWQLVAEAGDSPKYIVCNADESEPAAFKDRVLMEGDPHLLLEGMALAALAVGAERGVIYIRGEYERAATLLERAIKQAEARGLLGEKIYGTDFSVTIQLHRGAGAYICGEETALLESLEGRRGEPRIRPPYPTTNGLYGRPTVVNNVETLFKVPAIVARGAQWYRAIGTSHSPGTKLFTITGHVNRPGAFEAPFGITLRQAIHQFARGMSQGSSFKMALTGGAAGTIVGPAALDVPLDFASHECGISLGSGAIMVMGESVSVPTLLGWLLHFFTMESCGKCTPCREGTHAALQIIRRLECGDAGRDDVEQLRQLSQMLRLTSLCGLGQSVAWPIDSALENFPEEFPQA